MKNKEIKNQLHELTLIMKARAKKATPPKHGFGTHEEIIPVHTKTGKIAMQKRKVGITKKKAPASKKKAPKPKVKKNKTEKLPISGTSEYPYHLMKKNEFGQTIYPLHNPDGYPILPPEHEHKGSFEEKYGDNENYQSNITKHSLRSDKNLDFGYKVKNPPLWLEKALKEITPETLGFYTNEAYNHGGMENMLNVTKLHPERTRKLKAFFEYAIPLFKKNKIPYTFMLEQPYGRNYFNKELNRTMSSDHWIARNIEPKDLNDAYLVDPDNKEAGLKKIRKPKGSNDHMDWRTLFVQKLVIYIDSKHLPKAMALLDKQQIPQPTEPKTPQVPSKDNNGVPMPTPFDLGKVILGSVVSDENKAKFKQRYNPMNFNFNLDKKRKVEVKGFKDQNFTAPHNYTFDSLSINGKNLTKDYLLKKGVSDNFKDFNKLMEGIAKHRDSLLNFDLTKAIQDGLDDMQKVDGYKKGTKTENTERRKKFANALGLPLKPAPFKNWIKDKKIGNINGSKTDYFGFNDSIFNPIGEAKEQKIGWNNLVLDKNLKKADHIFLAPIDPFTKEVGVKGHTPYADVFVANSTTELYKLGIQNGVSNMGYGVFIIDTKNKTIEKMDIHALNKTTLEEAKKESEQIVKDNPFSIKPSKEQKPKMEETKPVINKESDAKNIAEKSKGMTVNGKPVTERDSKDFLEKYSKPLSGQFDAVGTRPFTSIKDKKDFHLDNEGKVNLLDKLLGDGLNESSFAENSKEDYYIKHLFENKFLESEKVGNNPETGYAKWKIKVRPQHKEGIKLFRDIISGK
jgi:hypothetical protein